MSPPKPDLASTASQLQLSLRTAVVFALAIAVVNGFGRFAYAMLLPVMRTDLGWDYALSGWLNTANSLGYGAGALAGMLLASRFHPAQLFHAGLALTLATLLAGGVVHNLWAMMLLRFACGLGSAWVFACGGALIARHYAHHANQSAAAIAIYYAGGGLGIALSGALALPVLTQDWHWSAGWLALGGAGAALAIWPAMVALGMQRTSTGIAPSTQAQANQVTALIVPYRAVSILALAYFCFGAGYIVYLTFVIAWLRELQLSVYAAVGVWAWLGLAVIASGWLWRKPMAKLKPKHTFAAASLCTAAGTALPLLPGIGSSLPILLISAALVGGSFFMVPGAVMAFTRAQMAPALWAKGMNFFTLIFALGQAAGPIAAGAIADASSLNWAMATGASLLIIGSAIALRQRELAV